MGCNCKGTTKGVANNSRHRGLILPIYEQYKETIGDTSIQYFTTEQRNFVKYKYYEVYPNSVEVDYKKANYELIKVFQYHKFI